MYIYYMYKYFITNSTKPIDNVNTGVIITNADLGVVREALNYKVEIIHNWLLANGYFSKFVCAGHPDPKGYGKLMKLNSAFVKDDEEA